MNDDDSWYEAQSIFEDAQDQLDTAIDREAEPAEVVEDTEDEGPRGEAYGMDGQIRVRVTPGRVADIWIDPMVMSGPADGLADAIASTTNAAHVDMKARMTADVPQAPDMESLRSNLNELSARSSRALGRASEGVQRSMAALQRISELHRRT